MTSVTDAIDKATGDTRIRLAMRMATAMECKGDFSGNCPGNGTHYGPYSILTQGTGISAADATDPTKATAIMLPRFQSCADKQNWNDPVTAAWATVVCAEVPGGDNYGGANSPEVRGVYQNSLKNLAITAINGAPVSGNIAGDIGTVVGGNVFSDIGNAPGAVKDIIASAVPTFLSGLAHSDTWVRALLIIGGAAFVLFGVQGLLRGEMVKAMPPVIPV